ncbi:Ig-like domain-containing protein [Herbaspirillum seropedicae]|uniref:Ig-like domain-containing protein n=1 Tax=Herbaspirillum seropedicae TaxID=964 RepID=UPI003FCE6704
MSNDQIKAGTHPVSNKQSTDSPVQLIMPATSPFPQPHSANGTGKLSGKKALARARSVDGKERVDEGQGELVQPTDEVMSQEQSLASAEAAMSARHVSEEEADVPRAGGEDSSERMQLAQADSDSSSNAAAVPAARSSASDAPTSVGEELLRQAAPVPRSREISFLDQLDDWLESDMALPVGLGAAALGFLALSGGGGGGSSGATGADTPPPAAEPPRNEWLMTVTPAAGVFLPSATVKLIAKKLMADGSWQEVANSTVVDANGRMTLKVAKGSLTAKDVIRLELSDTDPGKDYKDEVAGTQTLGGLKLEAYVGAWNADMAVTINPLTTMVVHKLDEAANAANAGGARGNNAVVNDAGAPDAGGAGAPGGALGAGGAGAQGNAAANAPSTPAYGADAAKFEAAIAKAFGIQSGDLVHTIPILLNGRPAAGASADAINYGLALGILSGMTQAQREAGAANPLQAALDLLKSAIQVNGGNVTFALETLRKVLISDSNVDVGLDAGAAKLHAAAVEDGNNSTIKGAQVPYLQVDTTLEKPYAGQTKPVWADAAVSFSSFTNGGLSLKVAPAASAKAGDQLLVEFLPLDGNGQLKGGGAKPFTFKYTYTEKDADAVRASAGGDPSNNGIGSFTLVVPTFDESAQFDPTKAGVLRTAMASSTPGAASSLLDVNNDGVYKINNGDFGYQLRASGAVMGAFASGASLNISTQSIGVEAAPNATGGVLFNGAGTPGTSNTVRFSVAIGQKINWSGADPTLEVRVAGHPTPLEATLVSGRNADVLTFKLDLTKPENKNLEGALSVTAHALKFSPNTTLSDVPGNTLFRTQDGSRWTDSSGTSVPDIDAALNVDTTLSNSGFSIDTTPPPTPVLTLPSRPAFDANNYAPDNVKPVSGSLNAAPAGAKFGEHAVVTNEPRIPFKVSFDAADNAQLKQGDRVKLVVDFPGTNGLEIASASLSKDTGGNWTATFDPASYSERLQQLITRFKTTTDLDKVTFSAVVVDQAGNQSVPGSLKSFAEGGVDSIWIDLKAPAQPSRVALNTASDTGRDGAPETRTDGITSMAKPTLQIEGGDQGGFARVYANADGTGLLGEGRISNGQSLTGGSVNSASVALTGGTGLVNGANTVYVQLIDPAGNKSEIQSKQIEVLLPLARDARADIALTSTAPHSGFYVTGDVIEVKVTFDRDIYLKQGKMTDQLYVTLIQDGPGKNAAKILNATYHSGLGKGTADPGSKVLTFKYTVRAGDDAPAGVTYKVGDLINVGQVLEDKAGSPVPGLSNPFDGAGLTIDTVAPPVPVLTLDADLSSHDARATAAVAKGQPLKVKGSEVGSKLAIKLTNADGVVENLEPLTATGADQTLQLTDAQIAKLGDGRIKVSAKASDTAGNASAEVETSFTLDTTAPTVSANVTATGGGQPPAVTNKPISFVVTFSEKLRVPVTADNFSVTNGEINKVEALTGASNANSYTVLVTPRPDMPAGSKVELKLQANGGAPVLDVAGNSAELGAVLASQAIDTRGPTVISVPAADAPPAPPTMNKEIVFNVRFDEMGSASAMGNIGIGNFKASNGKVTRVDPVGASRTEYNVTVKPNDGLAGNSNEVKLDFFAVSDIRMGQGSAGVADSLGNAAKDQPGIARQIIDVQQPSITADGVSVSSRTLLSGNPDEQGYAHAGDTLRLAVTFDEKIAVTGTPTLNLQVGANTRSASYKELSTDGKTAYFDYVLTAADTATDGVSIPANALQLPTGARITDLAGNLANVLSNAVPVNPTYKVDNSAPTLTEVKVSEMTADNGSGIYKAGSVITVQAKFSEPVEVKTTAAGLPVIKLTIGGDVRDAAYMARSPDEAPSDVLKFSYRVDPGDNAPAGVAIPASPLVLNSASITDVSGNHAVLTLGAGQPNPSFKIDTAAPTVTAVAIDSASASGTEGNYRAGDVITAVVTFSEEVKLAADAQASLNLMVGSESRPAALITPTANAAPNTLRFRYTLVSDDTDANGISIAANSLTLAGVTDKAGNAAVAAHVAVADNPLFKVDNAAPTILSFGTNTPDGAYNIGKVINLRATASDELRAGAKITVTLDNGDTAVLTRDASTRNLLEGSYTVVGGKSSSDLTVISFTQSAKDLAGNDLLTTMPAAGKNLGDNRAIVLDAMMPPQPSMFRLDAASDGGASPSDGLISEVLPTFHFEGLVRGATVTVTGTFKGVTQTLLQFTASAATQDQKLTTPLTDGVYTNISVIQTSPSGNASQPFLLHNETTPGSLELSTVAPGKASQLVFDIDQDMQTEASLEAGTPGNAPRDFITLIRTPKFNFQGGNDGEVAVLFRDTNGNNIVDAGEQVLGRQIIGVTNLTNYRLQPGTSGNGLNGHYVEVAPENALASGPYTDIKLALQSKYGTYGTAEPMVRSATSGPGAGGITVINNKPVPEITGVTTSATAGESSAANMIFNVAGGQAGARIIIKADRLGDNGAVIAAQQEIGRGVPDGNGVLTLQVGQLNGSYGNFKATQDYAGRISNVAVTTLTNTGPQPLGTIIWDHLPISVTASTDLAANSRPGRPFTVKFDFSKAPNGFAQDDIAVTGSGVLSAFAPVPGSNNKQYSATFTPTDATVTRATFQVKDGSYTEPNGQSGAASNKLELTFNRVGAVALSGASGTNGKPQVGDTLTATVSDPDGVKSTVPVAYVWKADGVAIADATGASLRLTEAQRGKPISVEARYTDNLGLAEDIRSVDTAAVLGPNAQGQVRLKVNGVQIQSDSAVVRGDTITAEVTDADGVNLSGVHYQWTVGSAGVAIPGASGLGRSSYQVPLDFTLASGKITVAVSYTDNLGNSEAPAGVELRVKAQQAPGVLTLLANDDGQVNAGELVSAQLRDDNGTPPSSQVQFQWSVNNVRISESTAHYLVQAADRGKNISVRAIYTDLDGQAENVSSTNFVHVAQPNNNPPTGAVTLEGSGELGTTVTASNTITDADGIPGQITYKWFASGDAATKGDLITAPVFVNNDTSKLVITSDLVGKSLKAEANYTDGQGTDEKVLAATAKTAAWMPTVTLGNLSFAQFDAQQPTQVVTGAKLISRHPTSNVFILDVNGDGQITAADATTYITSLDANGSVSFTTDGGRGKATLLAANSPLWATLLPQPAEWGPANGAFGLPARNGQAAVTGGDFWTSTAGTQADSHQVWSKSGVADGVAGTYEQANASYMADPNRVHFNVFQVSVLPA